MALVRLILALLLSLSVAVLVACDLVGGADEEGIVLRPLVGGLDRPTAIEHAGASSRLGGPQSGRLFIVEQPGRIRVWDGERLRPDPFLDLSANVSSTNEDGLLGLAFHPGYATNGRFFVYYTDTAGDVQLAEYSVSEDWAIANPDGEVLLTIPHPFTDLHNGGQIEFGPDGYLYVGVGDGAGFAGESLDLESLLGKILRLDVDAARPYAIPPDNPFAGATHGRDEIWAFGLRNPWRFSFDRLTGDLFIADVGQDRREEVNFVPAGSPGGANFGWPTMEGTACFVPPSGCSSEGLTLPILEYAREDGRCAIVGGYMHRGAERSLYGKYIYGDFCAGTFWTATRSGDRWTAHLIAETLIDVSTFGEDVYANLYVADYGTGCIYAIERAGDGDAARIETSADSGAAC